MNQRRGGLAIMTFCLIGAVGVVLGTVDGALGDASWWELLADVAVLIGLLFASVVGYRSWKRQAGDH